MEVVEPCPPLPEPLGNAHTEKATEIPRTHKPEGMTLEQWQIDRCGTNSGGRREFRSKISTAPRFSPITWSRIPHKRTYRVSIRGSRPGDNHCTCPDFSVNTLGTCKHVEFTLGETFAPGPAEEPQRRDFVRRFPKSICASRRTAGRPAAWHGKPRRSAARIASFLIKDSTVLARSISIVLMSFSKSFATAATRCDVTRNASSLSPNAATAADWPAGGRILSRRNRTIAGPICFRFRSIRTRGKGFVCRAGRPSAACR